jgi:cytochrome P450
MDFYVHHVDCDIGKAHQRLRNGLNPGFTAAAARSFQPIFDNVAQAASFVEEHGIPVLTS